MTKQKFLKQPNKSHVRMKISTWNKDSHGLYDYEASNENYRVEKYYIEASTVIFRDCINSITILQYESNLRTVKESFIPIASISIDRKEKNTTFKFQPKVHEANTDPSRNFYRVIRERNPQIGKGFALKPGNIVKMGRIEYMVIEMKNNTETLTIRDTNHFTETNGVFEFEGNAEPFDEHGNEIRCKVCLCNEETEIDPLISPCHCRGSVARIHVGCLKQWINSKVKKQISDIATSYNFTKFECEICKTPFPRIIKVQQEEIEMMAIQKPTKPYIILESINRTCLDMCKEERCLHVISAKEGSPLRIGRGHQCEIRLTDISVSRAHAQIIFEEDIFYIKDHSSKFGTLIKLDEPIVFNRDEVIKIQYGRSLYEFDLQGFPKEVDTDEEKPVE